MTNHTTFGLRHRPECGDPDNLRRFTGNRGDDMLGCRACGAALPVAWARDRHRRELNAGPPTPPRPEPAPRYVLACARCGNDIPVHSNRPRIPLCAGCSQHGRRRRRRPAEFE